MDRIDISRLEPVVPEPEQPVLGGGSTRYCPVWRDALGQYCSPGDPKFHRVDLFVSGKIKSPVKEITCTVKIA